MSDVFNDIHKALKDRKDFERKQDLWHRLRYRGVKRTNLPYEGAPNVTYPLADTLIEKIKPMFIQQIYGPQTVANFVAKKQQASGLSKAAEQWFDYQLKQNSNFETAIHSSIDEHLQDGFVVVKLRWDDKKDQLVVEGIDPLYIIVPWYSESVQDLDWIVHVYKVSVGQYKRNKNYTAQSEDFISQIKGKPSEQSSLAKEQDKEIREGITHTDNDNQIVLWEVYYRPDGQDKWQIRTISPIAGWDTPVRAEMPLPPSYGGELPFVKLSCDLNVSAWYAPRGVCEVAAKFQQALSKQWCNQLQWMDYNAQPDFKNTSNAPVNSQNFQRRPGGVLPPGIEPNRANEMPADFVQQMQFVRALAEDRIQVPDLGSSEHLVGNPGLSGEVTATQVNAVMGQSNQGNDMRSRLFRLQMAQIYRLAWKLLVKNTDEGDMEFLQDGNLVTVPKDALHLDYQIHPSGSADDWNTAAQAQKAFAAFQVLQANPNIDLRSLTEWLLEKVDVQLIRRVMAPAADSASQGLQLIAQFVQKSLATGTMTPDVAQLVLGIGKADLAELQQRKAPLAAQAMQQLAPFAPMLMQIASAPSAPAGAAQQSKPVSESISIKLSDLTPDERAQALAKAGIQATPGASSQPPPKKLAELTPGERSQALAKQGIVPTIGASSAPPPKPMLPTRA